MEKLIHKTDLPKQDPVRVPNTPPVRIPSQKPSKEGERNHEPAPAKATPSESAPKPPKK